MGKLTGRLQALQQALQADDPSEFLQIVSDHVRELLGRRLRSKACWHLPHSWVSCRQWC